MRKKRHEQVMLCFSFVPVCVCSQLINRLWAYDIMPCSRYESDHFSVAAYENDAGEPFFRSHLIEFLHKFLLLFLWHGFPDRVQHHIESFAADTARLYIVI